MSALLIEALAIPLQPLARIFERRCGQRGINVLFTSGRRTWAEQIEMFQKGRARTPEGWVVVDHTKVVTLALPDHAPHCRGGAFDCAPIVRERAAWDRLDLFAEMGRIGKECGLVWGGTFPIHDLDHFELATWRELPLEVT